MLHAHSHPAHQQHSPSGAATGVATINHFIEHPHDLLPAVHVQQEQRIEHHHQEHHHEESHSYEVRTSGSGHNLTLPRAGSGAGQMRKTSDSGILSASGANRQLNKKAVQEEWQKELEKKAIHHQVARSVVSSSCTPPLVIRGTPMLP
jgi:hypothetical protein